jgi:hypothetical protein
LIFNNTIVSIVALSRCIHSGTNSSVRCRDKLYFAENDEGRKIIANAASTASSHLRNIALLRGLKCSTPLDNANPSIHEETRRVLNVIGVLSMCFADRPGIYYTPDHVSCTKFPSKEFELN